MTMCVSVSGSHLLLLCFQRDAFPLAEPVKGLYARVNKHVLPEGKQGKRQNATSSVLLILEIWLHGCLMLMNLFAIDSRLVLLFLECLF